jgi:Flp pilus assembly protein TadG
VICSSLPAHKRGPRRSTRGAAAVEFALLSVVFFPLLFGLIDYGLWFSDSIAARSGVREGVRRAVVQADAGACKTGNTDYVDQVRCETKGEVGAISGPTYIKVVAPSGWAKGQPLVVCAMIKSNGVTGLVPLPNDRIIRSKTQLSIEVDTPTPTKLTTADTPPSGSNWNWCS